MVGVGGGVPYGSFSRTEPDFFSINNAQLHGISFVSYQASSNFALKLMSIKNVSVPGSALSTQN